ncbi:MAG: HutD family protein [Lachnospiraceae bacterium]|nr:HutD family protein [Lachnospiraceae bacterium]
MAEYSIRHKTNSEYNTSNWSGGTTTELGIGPEGSRYADRDFLWRISSATVDLEESTFTALPDYDRIIMTLEGEIDLCHNGGPWIHLNAFETHSFDGGDDTVSKGKVVDFNLMTRKGQAGGAMIPLVFPDDGTSFSSAEVLSEIETYKEVMIYCHRGPVTVVCENGCAYVLNAGESLWMRGDFSGAVWNMAGVAEARAVMAAVSEN